MKILKNLHGSANANCMSLVRGSCQSPLYTVRAFFIRGDRLSRDVWLDQILRCNIHVFASFGSYIMEDSCVKDQSCWSHDCLVSITTSLAHCDIIKQICIMGTMNKLKKTHFDNFKIG